MCAATSSSEAVPSIRSPFRQVVAGSLRDFSRCWRTLAVTDLAYKAFAFAVLGPATLLLVRLLISQSGEGAVADADIARFILTTPAGIAAALVTAVFSTAIAALEAGCLMVIGLGASRDARIRARAALAFGAHHAAAIVRLAANMLLRVVAGLLPFVAAIGAVYFGLLRAHDINYYLATKPPEFFIAVTVVGVVVAALVVLLVRTAIRWALALPLVLFDDVHPRHALHESAKRSEGHRSLIAMTLAAWAAVAIGLTAGSTWLIEALARTAAPHFAGSAALLVVFLACLAILWILSALVVGVIQFALFAVGIVRLWTISGVSAEIRLPGAEELDGLHERFSRRLVLAGVATVTLLAVGFALVAFYVARGNEKVVILAHRGSSVTAPENTLAAFKLAVAEHADYVELDVQESKDGVVLVVHDSDLMKIGRSPMKIWEHTAAELRTVDIGSYKGPQFRGEHVATLEEALGVVKGSPSKMMIELKSYGHGEQLEQRVIDIVENAGMVGQCEFMSLDHGIVGRMKALRPSWRTGVLIAKAVGDPTKLQGDFLAVETRMATPRFIRRAHLEHRDVYLWTVDDPAWMLTAATRGADGLITNKPAIARQVMERRAQMSDAQRFLVAMLVRSGAQVEALEAESALRP